MNAGRELDALVAEKVMGEAVRNGWILLDGKAHCPVQPYSTSIADAWEVVENIPVFFKLQRDSFGWTCSYKPNPTTIEEMSVQEESVRADSAPLAICLAALASDSVYRSRLVV